MTRVTPFERFFLSQPIPALGYPGLPDSASDIDVLERGWLLGLGHWIPRSDENVRRMAMIVGILPASEQEIRTLERLEVSRFKFDEEGESDEIREQC